MPLPTPEDHENLGDEYSEEPLLAQTGEEEVPPVSPSEAPPSVGYGTFDPMLARPSRFDPVDEDGEVDLAAGKPRLADDEGNPLPEFDPRYREDFHGLAFLGALSKRFEWLGHQFSIRTLNVDESLLVAMLVKQYDNTIGDGLAYRTAVVALAVQQVDGQDLPVPVGRDGDFAYAVQRFDYAKARWFQYTIDAIYNEYLELDFKARQVVDAMGKASALTASTSG